MAQHPNTCGTADKSKIESNKRVISIVVYFLGSDGESSVNVPHKRIPTFRCQLSFELRMLVMTSFVNCMSAALALATFLTLSKETS